MYRSGGTRHFGLPAFAQYDILSQREFLQAAQNNRPTDVKSIMVRIRFSDGSIYDQVGEINFSRPGACRRLIRRVCAVPEGAR